MGKRKIKDWEWNPECMKDEEGKEAFREDPREAGIMLVSIGVKIVDLVSSFKNEGVSLFTAACKAKDLWDAVNYARLWSEKHNADIDSLLQDALGNLADAYWMIEGMWADGTSHLTTYQYIKSSYRDALELIQLAVSEIDNTINQEGDTSGNNN